MFRSSLATCLPSVPRSNVIKSDHMSSICTTQQCHHVGPHVFHLYHAAMSSSRTTCLPYVPRSNVIKSDHMSSICTTQQCHQVGPHVFHMYHAAMSSSRTTCLPYVPRSIMQCHQVGPLEICACPYSEHSAKTLNHPRLYPHPPYIHAQPLLEYGELQNIV